jgi:acetylornithine deacetylase
VCGPGSIEQAHKPNEFIELAQVEACASFLRKLMERMT